MLCDVYVRGGLNVNPHFHTLVLDGVFRQAAGRLGPPARLRRITRASRSPLETPQPSRVRARHNRGTMALDTCRGASEHATQDGERDRDRPPRQARFHSGSSGLRETKRGGIRQCQTLCRALRAEPPARSAASSR